MSSVLLVEDELLIRELAFDYLDEAGFAVEMARDGKEALGILQQGRSFDLLFTDIKMPGGFDGTTLALEARQILPELKVIFATGYADVALNPGEHERIIQKPYSRHAMFGALRSLGFGQAG